MALIKCPECGKEISDKAKSCPNCGYINNIDNSNCNMYERISKIKNKSAILISMVVVLGLISGSILFLTKDIRRIAQDHTAPQFKNVINEVSTMVGETVDFKKWMIENNITAVDNVSKELNIKIDDSTVDFETPGEYLLSLTAVDEAENVATKKINIIVEDFPTHKAYEEAVNLTYEQLEKANNGGYSFNGIKISEVEAQNIEDGTIYRSIAQQLEGYYIFGKKYYGNWGDKTIKLVSGNEKAVSWEEMHPYMDNVTLLISKKVNVGAIMSIFQSLNSVNGEFNYLEGVFSFTISNLTEAAQELNITEQMLGYILAMLEEYGGNSSFTKNSYNLDLKFVGQRGIDETDYISYENWDEQLNLFEDMTEPEYRYYYWIDPNNLSGNETYGIFTNRNLQLKHSLDAVIFTHAGGEVKPYQKDNDIIYQALVMNNDSNYKCLESCTQYISYTIGNSGNIIYYFNDVNELLFIAYTNTVVY